MHRWTILHLFKDTCKTFCWYHTVNLWRQAREYSPRFGADIYPVCSIAVWEIWHWMIGCT